MLSIKILSVKESEQNPYANSSLANNGGGYSQPLYEYVVEVKTRNHTLTKKIVIDDSSCGDFGERYEVSIDDRQVIYHDGVGCNIHRVECTKLDKYILCAIGMEYYL